MDEDIKIKLLEKIDMAIDAIDKRNNADFNEKVSCVVCNLASAYSCLYNENISR